MSYFKVEFTKYYKNSSGICDPYVLDNLARTGETEIVEAENDTDAVDKLAKKYGIGYIGHLHSVKSIANKENPLF